MHCVIYGFILKYVYIDELCIHTPRGELKNFNMIQNSCIGHPIKMCILVVHLPSECLIHQQVWENIVLDMQQKTLMCQITSV